jgi:hypothetical protein
MKYGVFTAMKIYMIVFWFVTATFRRILLPPSCTLNMKAARSSETLATIYMTVRRHNAEDHSVRTDV